MILVFASFDNLFRDAISHTVSQREVTPQINSFSLVLVQILGASKSCQPAALAV